MGKIDVEGAMQRINEFLDVRQQQDVFYNGTEGHDNLGTKAIPLRISDVRLLFRVTTNLLKKFEQLPEWHSHEEAARMYLRDAEDDILDGHRSGDKVPTDLLLKAALAHAVLEMVTPDVKVVSTTEDVSPLDGIL